MSYWSVSRQAAPSIMSTSHVTLALALSLGAVMNSATAQTGKPTVATAQTEKPTVVLVHGAFAESASWNGVVAELLAHGYPVVAAANVARRDGLAARRRRAAHRARWRSGGGRDSGEA